MKKKVRRFKLHQGLSKIYDISRENYEELVQENSKYVFTGKDKVKRYFAICPACDNPIQLVGLYKKLKNTDHPYGKHYNRDIPIAKHNQQTYWFCPYASHSYHVNWQSRKEQMGDFEINIYKAVRNYFDLALYIIEQDTGLYISERLARRILNQYLETEGYMYYWATFYNIPWMLLYFMGSIPCYGLVVRRESELWKYLSERKDICFEESFKKDYDIIKNNGSFLNLNMTFIHHCRDIIEDSVCETLQMTLSSTKKDGLPKTEHKIILDINEYRFPNFSRNAKYRNQKFLEIAEEIMPEL